MFDSAPTAPAASTAAGMAALLAVLTAKHVLADFVLQPNWMARGKEAPSGWAMPLLAHAATHAALTLTVVLAIAPRLWWLALADLAVHTGIDRGKALVALRARWRPDQPQFWWLLGVDQGLHQLTGVGLALAMVVL